jgi:hypothetical protein
MSPTNALRDFWRTVTACLVSRRCLGVMIDIQFLAPAQYATGELVSLSVIASLHASYSVLWVVALHCHLAVRFAVSCLISSRFCLSDARELALLRGCVCVLCLAQLNHVNDSSVPSQSCRVHVTSVVACAGPPDRPSVRMSGVRSWTIM